MGRRDFFRVDVVVENEDGVGKKVRVRRDLSGCDEIGKKYDDFRSDEDLEREKNPAAIGIDWQQVEEIKVVAADMWISRIFGYW